MNETQDEPIETGHDDATFEEKVHGIIAQVKADVALGHDNDVRILLEQRLADAGLEIPESRVDAALAEITE